MPPQPQRLPSEVLEPARVSGEPEVRVVPLELPSQSTALAAKAVVEAAGEGYIWRHVDRVAVKGKSEARIGVRGWYRRVVN